MAAHPFLGRMMTYFNEHADVRSAFQYGAGAAAGGRDHKRAGSGPTAAQKEAQKAAQKEERERQLELELRAQLTDFLADTCVIMPPPHLRSRTSGSVRTALNLSGPRDLWPSRTSPPGPSTPRPLDLATSRCRGPWTP